MLFWNPDLSFFSIIFYKKTLGSPDDFPKNQKPGMKYFKTVNIVSIILQQNHFLGLASEPQSIG